MTLDYLTPMELAFALPGDSPYSLDTGIDATLQWLEASEMEPAQEAAAGAQA